MNDHRDSWRREDMSTTGKLRVLIQEDGDVVVALTAENHGSMRVAWVEFCAPLSGGGRSPATWKALHALYLAIEEDNHKDPRNGGKGAESAAPSEGPVQG